MVLNALPQLLYSAVVTRTVSLRAGMVEGRESAAPPLVP